MSTSQLSGWKENWAGKGRSLCRELRRQKALIVSREPHYRVLVWLPSSLPVAIPANVRPERHINQSEQNIKPRPSHAETRGCMAEYRKLNGKYER